MLSKTGPEDQDGKGIFVMFIVVAGIVIDVAPESKPNE